MLFIMPAGLTVGYIIEHVPLINISLAIALAGKFHHLAVGAVGWTKWI